MMEQKRPNPINLFYFLSSAYYFTLKIETVSIIFSNSFNFLNKLANLIYVLFLNFNPLVQTNNTDSDVTDDQFV